MTEQKKTFLKRKPKGLTLRERFAPRKIHGIDPGGLKWSPDGKTLAFTRNTEGEFRQDIFVVRPGETQPVKLTDSSTVPSPPVEDDERDTEDVAYQERVWGGIGDFVWAPDSRSLYYFCRNKLFRLSVAGGEPKCLISGDVAIGGLQFSLDGAKLGFTMKDNFWTYDLAAATLTQVTSFGNKADVSAGGFQWSPDGKWVFLTVTDKSMYGTVKMPDYSPEDGVKIQELRRSNAGEPLAKTRLGVVPATGGLMTRIRVPSPNTEEEKEDEKGDKDELTPTGRKKKIEIDTGEHFIGNTVWTWDSSKLLITYKEGGDHSKYRLVAVTPGSDEPPVELFRHDQEPWAHCGAPAVSPDSKWLYITMNSTGWSHIYRLPVEGGEPEQLTFGERDVGGIQIPRKGDGIFFSSGTPDPRQTAVYRIGLDGGEPVRVTPEGRQSSGVTPSDDARSLAITCSDVMNPGELYVRRDGEPEPAQVLKVALPEFDQLGKVQIERFSFKNEWDGVEVFGRMTLPENFDRTKRHPVVFSCVYFNIGKEGFSRFNLIDSFMTNEMGYIVVNLDVRGSGGYGRAFSEAIYERFGIVEAQDCASCANYLKTLPFVDGDRIGIWGGSYGGFLVLMALCNHPGVFKAGIAWKPVTDWRNYWDGYIAPFIGRPKEDFEVYKACSPIFLADGLEGNLLLVHGMQDDNVLFQDTVWMIQKLIEAGKYFDLMIYPKDDHGFTKRRESGPDFAERLAAYFEQHMGLGPEAE